eukprot:983304-Prorocentrum_minimum.AAC.2
MYSRCYGKHLQTCTSSHLLDRRIEQNPLRRALQESRTRSTICAQTRFIQTAQLDSVKCLVASKNPAKVKAVSAAIEEAFPTRSFRIERYSVPSGVPDQPVGDAETLLGSCTTDNTGFVASGSARNRVRNLAALGSVHDLLVAIEGGVRWDDEEQLECFAWVVVKSGSEGAEAKARSASFVLPTEVAELVRGGMELGDADDQWSSAAVVTVFQASELWARERHSWAAHARSHRPLSVLLARGDAGARPTHESSVLPGTPGSPQARSGVLDNSQIIVVLCRAFDQAGDTSRLPNRIPYLDHATLRTFHNTRTASDSPFVSVVH